MRGRTFSPPADFNRLSRRSGGLAGRTENRIDFTIISGLVFTTTKLSTAKCRCRIITNCLNRSARPTKHTLLQNTPELPHESSRWAPALLCTRISKKKKKNEFSIFQWITVNCNRGYVWSYCINKKKNPEIRPPHQCIT